MTETTVARSVAAVTAAWLCLAAAPTFAVMAILTAVLSRDKTDLLCLAEHASMLTGMVPMYVLMSAFSTPPWLKLIASRRRAVCR